MASLLEQAMSAFRSGNSAEGARLLALSSSTSPGSTGEAAIVHDTIEPTVTPVPISASASKPPPPTPQVTPRPVIVFSEEERFYCLST